MLHIFNALNVIIKGATLVIYLAFDVIYLSSNKKRWDTLILFWQTYTLNLFIFMNLH